MKRQFKKNSTSIIIILGLMLLFFSTKSYSQVSTGCNNADFEYGNFTNWTGYRGTFSNGIVTITYTGINAMAQAITTGAGTDPNTINPANGNPIPVVAPNGGLYSCRLGNSGSNNDADRLTYTFVVSNSNDIFYYNYAVVLEDPVHDYLNQPRFEIDVLDSAGNFIPDTIFGRYLVVSGPVIYLPGFYTSTSGYRCKNWTAGGILLSDYIGHTVTVQFTATHCGYGGHFGYAYIDAGSAPFEITENFCAGNSTGTLTAPVGFTYSWTGPGITAPDTNRTITLPASYSGSTYTCIFTCGFVCGTDTLTKIFSPVQVNANFSNTSNGGIITFTDMTTVTGSDTVSNWFWDFGDGNTSNLQNPIHNYSFSGSYNVTLIATSSIGCIDTIVLPISVTNGLENIESHDISLNIYPNPCNDFVNINYELNKNSQVNIEVYGMMGNKIETLINETQKTGNYFYKFNNGLNNSDICLIKFIINNSVYIKKIIKIK